MPQPYTVCLVTVIFLSASMPASGGQDHHR